MSIKADLFTDAYGNIIMSMTGHLSFEILPHLRDEFLYLAKRSSFTLLMVDFKNIHFVGSSGIGNFVELVNAINKDKIRLKMFNVSPEFKKVFKLYKIDNEEKIILGKDSSFFSNEEEEIEEPSIIPANETLQKL